MRVTCWTQWIQRGFFCAMRGVHFPLASSGGLRKRRKLLGILVVWGAVSPHEIDSHGHHRHREYVPVELPVALSHGGAVRSQPAAAKVTEEVAESAD